MKKTAAALLLALALAPAAQAGIPFGLLRMPYLAKAATQAEQTATGRVTGVADGDTFYVDIGGVSTRVRLAQIDAPEKAQPFGHRSEQSLRELIAKQTVTVTWREVDRYGRPVVQVRVGGLDVNAEQVRRGMAWVYRRYAHDPALIELESEARQAKRGLWTDPHPIEPWEWRKMHKSGDVTPAGAGSAGPAAKLATIV